MGFTLVILEPKDPGAASPAVAAWPAKVREAVPDALVHYCPTIEQAADVIPDADAAFGDIAPDLFQRA